MIIKRVNIWSIEPIFCSNFNYISSSKTEMTKNNKSVLFLGGKCVYLWPTEYRHTGTAVPGHRSGLVCKFQLSKVQAG